MVCQTRCNLNLYVDVFEFEDYKPWVRRGIQPLDDRYAIQGNILRKLWIEDSLTNTPPRVQY